jgi:hypothetical protein
MKTMKKKNTILLLVAAVVVIAALLPGCKPIPYYLQMVYKVHGTVRDADSGDPIESVEVFISTYQYSDLTNGLGDYELEMAAGTWTIEFVKEGYESQFHDVTCSETDPRIRLDVDLVPTGGGGPSGENIIFGTVSLAQWMIGLGMDPPIAQGSPLMVNAMTEDGAGPMYIRFFPEDEFEYRFPYAYEIPVDGGQSFGPVMALYDSDGNGALSSDDLVGWVWETVFLEEGGTVDIDIVLTDQIADGTIKVGLSDLPDGTAGKAAYLAVVDPYTGDPEDPSTWLGAGTFVISDEPGAENAAFARDPVDYVAGEIVTFPGGLYAVYLFIDLAGNGFPPDPGDLGASMGMYMLFGDSEVLFSLEELSGF